MGRIRSTGTKLDVRMRDLLTEANISFEMYPRLYGKPDFLLGSTIVLFCDSAFWHGKNWGKLMKQLQSGHNADYWIRHIAKNRARDRDVTRKLEAEGYRVIRFWDADVYKKPEWCIARLGKALERDSGVQ